MKRTIILLVLTLVISAAHSIAQVAINADGSDPDASAIMDLKSSDKGILIPRVTLNDVSTPDPVTNPATGLIIFNADGTETVGLYCWDGNKWQIFDVGSGYKDIYGNPAIVAMGNSTSTTVAVCNGTGLSLSSSNNGSWDGTTPTYSWTGPNSFTSSETSPGVITTDFNPATQAGYYTVTITNGIATGCSYSSTIEVTEETGNPAITAHPENLELIGTGGGSFSVSTNNATEYQWQEDQGGGSGFNDLNNTSIYNNVTTNTLIINDGTGMDGYEYRCVTTNTCGSTTSNSATLTVIDACYNPATGKTWLDRNLGASREATSSADSEAYGDCYQWGRAADGHQMRTSGTTSINASTAVPNLGNPWDGLFITESSFPHDWLIPQDNTLWQGVSGTNNPCPSGYRLPTSAEWGAERASWSSNNAAGAFASTLKLPAAGYHATTSNGFIGVGSSGQYWASTVSGAYSGYLLFTSSNAGMYLGYRVAGFSVRCLKDTP